MNNQLNPFKSNQPKKKKSSVKRGDGFFEAIGEIGRSFKTSIKDDFLEGTAEGVKDQLLNISRTKSAPEKQPDNFDFAEWIQLKEEEVAQENLQKGRKLEKRRQQFQPENIVFSQADHRLEQEIQEVRQELQLLIQAIGQVEQQVETAVVQEVVDPGVYHLNFFQKLATWLRMIRKNLQEGEIWMEMWHSRSKRSAYWNGVKKSGTSFMLSGERSVVTQTG